MAPCPRDFRRALASMSARTKNFLRAWLQHAASVTGPGRAPGVVELAVAAIGVGLQDAGEAREMSLGMFARSVARIIEHRRRRRGAAEGAVVAHIGPTSPNIGLSLGEHGHGGVVAMQPRGGEDMGLQQIENRTQHGGAGAEPGRRASTGSAARLPWRNARPGGSAADAGRTSRTRSSPRDWGRPNPEE